MSDQDTTAPGKMTVTIKRAEVAADDPDRFVHGFEKYIYQSWDGWALFLADCIADAALEEMRVRAAVVRAIQVPHCLHCGGLLARPCGCETPGCRPGMAQTAICRSCAGPVPDGLYPCPACQYAPWQEGAIVVVNGVPSWKET